MADSYDIWLSCSVTNRKHLAGLLKDFGNARNVFDAPKEMLEAKSELTAQEMFFLLHSNKDENRKRLSDYVWKNNIRYIMQGEKEYPSRFACLSDPPVGIYVQGKLPNDDTPSVAIIGSRKSSLYGENTAALFASFLAANGVTVISGIALGIDGAAHRAALPYEGRTLGVLGSGIGVPYPKENWNLYREMRDKACIISEYGPEVPPLKQHFPQRNRLISAMSDGILVIEAAERSGTLITVDRGLEQGKEIYAVPGRISDRNSCGCNELIKQGAQLVTSPEEILYGLSDIYPSFLRFSQHITQTMLDLSNDSDSYVKLSKNSENDILGLAQEEKVVYSLCRLDTKHFDELAEQSGLPVPQLSDVLDSLQNKGFIQQKFPNYYSGATGRKLR